MKLRALKYLSGYFVPLVVFGCVASSSTWSFAAPVIFFLIIPLIEMLLKGSDKNLDQVEEELALKDRVYDYLLYALIPVQYGLLVFYLFQVDDESLSLAARMGMTLAFGISCGVIGINAAHELGHRVTRYERLMSKMLLLTSLYLHFYIEHNRGHHKYVSTLRDPASSRRGEPVYFFWLRSVWGSWWSAWRLEAARLKKGGHRLLSLRNEMLLFQLAQVVFAGTIGVVWGWQTLLFFLGAAMVGILLLETVNYIEHYGLMRKTQGDSYARTLPAHSWNSNHPLGRLMLFELSRHSDHHFLASRKYQVLRHFEESPQMPTGYPGMMLLSMVPPLWFFIMHRRIEKFRKTEAGKALA